MEKLCYSLDIIVAIVKMEKLCYSLDIVAIVKMVKLCYSFDIVAIGNLQGSQVGAVIMAAAGAA